MRPLRLTMQAFGSYGKKEEIDFTKPNQNLFLITGDTGAGKTTIFDAIVFAIYGEASSGSNKKDGFELQSQFVDYDTEPFVELIFSEGKGEDAQIYTVRRVPRHVRPLKKGTGVKDEKEVVSLTLPDGLEYSQNTRETNAKLEEIVGLTKGQFMQVAMIAQGEFMELLRARSDDKKVIFRKLFHTQMYQNIVDELGRRRREKLSEIAQIRTVCQTEVSHISVPDHYESQEPLLSLKKRILSSDRLLAPDMEALLEELKRLCDWLQKGKQEAQKEYEKARAIRDEKRDAFVTAQNLQKFFKQLERAEQTLAECERAKEEIESAVRLLGQIHAAYEIDAVYQRYEDTKKTVADTEKKWKEQQDSLPVLDQAYQEASERETAAREQRELELENFTKVSERVKKALESLERIEEAKADTAAKKAALRKTIEAAEAARRNLTDLERREMEWRKQSEELGEADKLLALWKVKREEAAGIAADAAAAKKIQNDTRLQRQKAQKARQDYAKARENFASKNAEYLEKQTAFLDAQAGFIAKEKLREGQPCPVCGSIEHPHPCRLAGEHQDLTREMIDALAREVSALQKEQQEKSGMAQSACELQAEKEANLEDAVARLRLRMEKQISGVPQNLTVEEAKQLIMAWQESVEAEGAVLRKNSDILAGVREALRGAQEAKQALREAAEGAAQKETEAKTALAGSQAALKGLEATRDYRTKEEAKAALGEAKKAKDEKDTAYNSAYTNLQRAKTAKENAKTLILRYSGELPGQKEELQRRRAFYEKVMEEKHLTDAEWKAITGRYRKDETQRLQLKIDAYNRKKTAAESMRDAAREAIGKQKRPVMEELEAEKTRSEENLSRIQTALEQIREECKTDSGVYGALAPKMEERGRIMEEHKRLDDLYNRLAGKVTGSRMDIETFVQRYYLERILYAANARFREMSAGQFELRMYDMEKAGEGKNRGLDLMVYSTVTGKEREVRTLSGGESFMAALSLALGMADQIQEGSAAIHLDVMFIDEGFGSLDEHSRNQAVKVLQQMASGSKLIGIISHVSELKQEMEDQLIVSKDENGSHTRWQIS